MKSFIVKNKNYILISAYALLALLFCSKSSPLFYFNDWVDANSFFTVGKSIFHGMTLYKDIFEQKGPVLYLIHGLGYLLSHTTFYGVFIFEAAAFAIALVYTYKALLLFYDEKISLLGAFILPVFILGAQYFSQGDSAEEYILCAQIVSLYYILKYFKDDYLQKEFNCRHMLLHGTLFSAALLIKYSIAVFWALPVLAVFISLLANRQYRAILSGLLMFLAGCAIIIIPWIIYFAVNGALGGFIDVYFLFNVKYYTNSENNITGLVSLTGVLLNNGSYLLDKFKLEYGVIILGLLYFIFYPSGIKWWQRLFIAASCGAVFAAIFFNGIGHVYYSMGIAVFILFGVMALCKLIELIKLPLRSSILAAAAVAMLCLTVYRNPYHQDSLLFSRENTSSAVQIEFAQLMHETDDPTLLNFGFLDGGFFTVADIVPNIRYFERQNKIYETYPENRLEHERYIREKVVDYVVRRIKKDYYTGELESVPYLDENYELIAQREQWFEGYYFIYFLYRGRV